MIKALLLRAVQFFARRRVVRGLVKHVIYPNVIDCLHREIKPDVKSPSGIAEALAWKSHAYLILSEELAVGKNCCGEAWCSNRESRAKIIQVILDSVNNVRGDIFEFGVAAGDSFLQLLRACPDRAVYGFDSFEGLPEDWWTRPKGAFRSAAPEFSDTNGHLVKGWFDESVPRFFERWNGSIAFLHIDCDLYSSTEIALRYALDWCGPGSVVLFDEYFNYPGFAAHEWLAWRQARASRGIAAQCIAYDGRRAAFRIDAIGCQNESHQECMTGSEAHR